MSDPQQPSPSAQPAPPAQPPYGFPQQYAAPAGYAQPGYPQSAAAAPAPAGSLGRVAFVLALICALINMMFLMATPLILTGMRGDFSVFEALSIVRTIVVLLMAIAALILGLIAARQRAQPVLAGIAIGIGGVEALGTLVSLGSSFAFNVL